MNNFDDQNSVASVDKRVSMITGDPKKLWDLSHPYS